MKLEIKAEGINDEAIKILVKAIKKLYYPYNEHYIGREKLNIVIGDDDGK